MKLSVLLTGIAAVSPAAAKFPIVNTTAGYIVGASSEYRDGVTVFKGIPYAAPPTGANRWKAPQSPTPWSGIRNTTAFAPECAQPGTQGVPIFPVGNSESSEDCLYLNVWTPTYNDTLDIASKQLPVYFWIFGGRFEGGDGDSSTYDGAGLAVKDIVVVTINYRLGAFGYLAHPDLGDGSGNFGVMDMQFALQWVHANIENFGGNASHIVVGGQSAGSAGALDMMYSPLSKHLVSGVIAQSGARGPRDPVTGSDATSYRTKPAAEAQGIQFIRNLNVSTVDEARNVSADTLITFGSDTDTIFEGTVLENNTDAFREPPLWRPVLDGYVLTRTYGEALRSGDHADVPILTGNNKDESGASATANLTTAEYRELYIPMFGNLSTEFLALYPDSDPTNNSNELFRDLSRIGTYRWATDWAAGGAESKVYTYYWTHTPPVQSTDGAYHGSELWYVFNNIPYADNGVNVSWSAQDYAIQENMSGYWANFIKTGDPNGDGLPYFPPTDSSADQTMWLGNSWESGPLTNLTARIAFVDKYYSTLTEW